MQKSSEPGVLDTVATIRPSFRSDFFGSFPSRAAAYAHTLGEACAAVVPRVSLPLSAVTAGYVLLSSIDRGRRARETERFPDIATLVGRKVTCEQFITQWTGLIYLPTAVVGGASSMISGALRGSAYGLPPFAVRYLPIAVPLLLSPLAVPACVALSEAASAWAMQPLLDSLWPTAVRSSSQAPSDIVSSRPGPSTTSQDGPIVLSAADEEDFLAWQASGGATGGALVPGADPNQQRLLAWALDGDLSTPFPEDVAAAAAAGTESGASTPGRRGPSYSEAERAWLGLLETRARGVSVSDNPRAEPPLPLELPKVPWELPPAGGVSDDAPPAAAPAQQTASP